LYLQTLRNKESDVSKKEILNSLSGMVDSAVKQVREISHNLSPYLLRDAGLVEAIRTHIRKFNSNGIDAQLDIQGNEAVISQSTQIVLYRVFLELLHNTLKHAGASIIRIHLMLSAKDVIFRYTDNGKGFDPRQQTGSGIGLRNIENRVKALNGTLKFEKEPTGMTTTVRIPL
jgi:signal transduction histidine kinase